MTQTVLVRDSTQPAGSQQSFAALPSAAMAAGAAVANIGSHGVTSLLLAAEFLALPRLITNGGIRLAAAAGSGDYPLYQGGGFISTASASAFGSSPSAGAAFYFDPALYALTGLTTKLMIVAEVITNNTAPAATFITALYPVSASASAGTGATAISVGAIVTGSGVTFTTPGTNAVLNGSATNITAPAAGMYALGFNNSATTAASSCPYLGAQLYVYWV